MTPSEKDLFLWGYHDYRSLIRGRLSELLASKEDLREALGTLVNEIENEELEEAWQSTQEEFPGITREEYEKEVLEGLAERTRNAVREKFYSEKGFRKPRLVRDPTSINITLQK